METFRKRDHKLQARVQRSGQGPITLAWEVHLVNSFIVLALH
jgi:hypothetical protein